MENFEKEVLQKLARIEANQEKDAEHCASYQEKVDRLEKNIASIEASAKSAHHRIDEMNDARNELKKDLTDVIVRQISGIYRTAAIMGGIISFLVGLFMWVVK